MSRRHRDAAGSVVEVSAQAHPVQGLVCVHGYASPRDHLLPVDGVFLCVDAITVRTRVACVIDQHCEGPEGISESHPTITSNQGLSHEDSTRIDRFLARVAPVFGITEVVSVEIAHDIAIGAGLGSSAAVFASLAQALSMVTASSGRDVDLCSVARMGSYSAAASMVGGISVIHASGVAEPLRVADDLDLATLVFPISPRSHRYAKRSQDIHADVLTSPYYRAWCDLARSACDQVVKALAEGDFTALRTTAERYALANLAVMITGDDQRVPWEAETLRCFHALRDLRDETGMDFGISVNSGPSVFAYGARQQLARLARVVEQTRLATPVYSLVGGPATPSAEGPHG
jgi:mevalonate pyrophosphate decarboxylase